jgi:NAD(P)-dependent dehydrogenase (short-subunit alcohol dehydrogenase family)
MNILQNKTKRNKSAVIIGPFGNLGPTWIEALSELDFQIHGAGLPNTKPTSAQNLETFQVLDLLSSHSSDIEKYLDDIKPDVVVINSGIDSTPGTGQAKLEDYEIDSWAKMISVNILGAVKILNAIIRTQSKPCSVVLIGSLYSTVSPNPELYSHFNDGTGTVKHPAYATTKSALVGLMRQYASHVAKSGIRINMLSPGGIKGAQDSEFKTKFENKTPFGRLGESGELKSALKFLVDENNTYLIGHNLVVDGGFLLW